MKNGLVLEGVGKSYVDRYSGERTDALRDVSLEIGEGEFVSVLGPSGCGKTTLLNIIAGFVEPTSGRILLRGRPVSGPGPDRGVVFQNFALFPWKTVRGNVAFGPKMRGISSDERDRIAREYIELVGLTGSEDKFPHELSGGMQQRVGVARVLANAPAVMLMDEPFASVDAQTRMTLQEEVTRVWEARRPTVVFITHDVDEAVFLSERVVVLTQRPGSVRELVPVDIPRPRRWDDLVDDADFKRLTHRVLQLIRRDQGGTPAQGRSTEEGPDATAP